jgi:hypothetical protein
VPIGGSVSRRGPPRNKTEDEPLLPEHICENEAERYEWRAAVLEFIRDRIESAEIYRLGEADLRFGVNRGQGRISSVLEINIEFVSHRNGTCRSAGCATPCGITAVSSPRVYRRSE